MTKSLPGGENTALCAMASSELQAVILAVDGVTALFPAQPLWQSIVGAAVSAVSGEAVPPVVVATGPDGVTVKARIGVDAVHQAPDVVRSVARAVRHYVHPRRCTVEVVVVQLGG